MHFIHAKDFSLLTKFILMHIVPWSEDDFRQLSKIYTCIYIYIYIYQLKRQKLEIGLY